MINRTCSIFIIIVSNFLTCYSSIVINQYLDFKVTIITNILYLKWENDPVNLLTERVLTRSHKLGIKGETFKSKL